MALSVRDRLQSALPAAMKGRQASAMSALRSALSAIANAEAVRVSAGEQGQAIAGELTGLGAGEVDRRELSEEDMVAIVLNEIAERLESARLCDERGEATAADEFRHQAEVLQACVDDTD